RLATAVLVGTHRTTGRATQAGADCRAGTAADRLAYYRAQYSTQCATYTCSGIAACRRNAAQQAK
ncbi:hypothetical protein PPS11_39278, partial [Pseudomonas putida S11]